MRTPFLNEGEEYLIVFFAKLGLAHRSLESNTHKRFCSGYFACWSTLAATGILGRNLKKITKKSKVSLLVGFEPGMS